MLEPPANIKALVDRIRTQVKDGLPGLQAKFREMDLDGSGCISLTEFKKGFRVIGIQNITDSEVDSLFRYFDFDVSGSVNLDEFVRGIEKHFLIGVADIDLTKVCSSFNAKDLTLPLKTRRGAGSSITFTITPTLVSVISAHSDEETLSNASWISDEYQDGRFECASPETSLDEPEILGNVTAVSTTDRSDLDRAPSVSERPTTLKSSDSSAFQNVDMQKKSVFENVQPVIVVTSKAPTIETPVALVAPTPSVQSTTNVDKFDKQPPFSNDTSSVTSAPSSSGASTTSDLVLFSVGDRVLDTEKNFKGVVRFVGPIAIAASHEIWVGVEWDTIGRGKNDGMLKDKSGNSHRYFSCAPGMGSFIRVETNHCLSLISKSADSLHSNEIPTNLEKSHPHEVSTVPTELWGQVTTLKQQLSEARAKSDKYRLDFETQKEIIEELKSTIGDLKRKTFLLESETNTAGRSKDQERQLLSKNEDALSAIDEKLAALTLLEAKQSDFFASYERGSVVAIADGKRDFEILKQSRESEFKTICSGLGTFTDINKSDLGTNFRKLYLLLMDRDRFIVGVLDKLQKTIDIDVKFNESQEHVRRLELEKETLSADFKFRNQQLQNELNSLILQHGNVVKSLQSEKSNLASAYESQLNDPNHDVGQVVAEYEEKLRLQAASELQAKQLANELLLKLESLEVTTHKKIDKLETALQEDKSKAQERLSTVEADAAKKVAEAEEKANRAISASSAEEKVLSERISKLQQQLDDVLVNYTDLSTESARKGSRMELERSLSDANETIFSLREEKKSLILSRNDTERRLMEATESLSILREDKRKLTASIRTLEDSLAAAESGLLASQAELMTLNRDLAALEKAMAQNHENLVVGASSNSCLGLSEIKEKEIIELKHKIASLEEDKILQLEFKKRLEADCTRRINEAEKKSKALFEALGASPEDSMITHHNPGDEAEIEALNLQILSLRASNDDLTEQVTVNKSMVESLGKQVINCNQIIAEQKAELRQKLAETKDLESQLSSLKLRIKSPELASDDPGLVLGELIECKMTIAQLHATIDLIKQQHKDDVVELKKAAGGYQYRVDLPITQTQYNTVEYGNQLSSAIKQEAFICRSKAIRTADGAVELSPEIGTGMSQSFCQSCSHSPSSNHL